MARNRPTRAPKYKGSVTRKPKLTQPSYSRKPAKSNKSGHRRRIANLQSGVVQ